MGENNIYIASQKYDVPIKICLSTVIDVNLRQTILILYQINDVRLAICIR